MNSSVVGTYDSKVNLNPGLESYKWLCGKREREQKRNDAMEATATTHYMTILVIELSRAMMVYILIIFLQV